MTIEEAIKTDMSTDDLARFLAAVDADIPKKWDCNEVYGCQKRKEDFICFKSFLKQEVKEVNKMYKIGSKIVSEMMKHYAFPKIAFCPYKASMFDCIESVYLAAVESELEPDIIPLDYQTFPDEEWHNEANLFRYPCKTMKNLKTGDYDIIVIHYPYDGCNNVTKLRQDCWVESLKKYGKVCYIPYHGNIAAEKWGRFYTMPGAVNSDYIVLGSDFDVKMFKSKNPLYGGKIIQTENSPKSEAPAIHQNDRLPEEWKELKRPITLIIGTLWTFTNHPVDRMLKHDEIVNKEVEAGHGVIYRPHPLVYNAICVMASDFKHLYDDFIKSMREEGVVIDDGPDLHRTIAIADKIYVDPSSVIKTIEGFRQYEVIE